MGTPYGCPIEHTPTQVVTVRHGETEWTISGRHTSRSDIPLTDDGRRDATRLAPLLGRFAVGLVLASPRSRARETCVLAGLADPMEIDEDLAEWDYGEYEGLTTAQIREERPG